MVESIVFVIFFFNSGNDSVWEYHPVSVILYVTLQVGHYGGHWTVSIYAVALDHTCMCVSLTGAQFMHLTIGVD